MFYLLILTFYICFKQIKYKAEGKKEFNNYSIVTDTPVYVTAILGHTWASEVWLFSKNDLVIFCFVIHLNVNMLCHLYFT